MTSLGSVTVCMATYNGIRFIGAQLASILDQIDSADEVVIVDDGSTDGTPDAIRSLSDSRIRLIVRSNNRGYVATFEEALHLATGAHIFLSDQDDVWPPGRVRAMQEALSNAHVVAGNIVALRPTDCVRPFGTFGSWRLVARMNSQPRRMTLRLALANAPYYGSAMAVSRELLTVALPFPPCVTELHDAWLALLGLRSGTISHVEVDVVRRRTHGANASGRVRSPHQVLRGRIRFLQMWVAAGRRLHGDSKLIDERT